MMQFGTLKMLLMEQTRATQASTRARARAHTHTHTQPCIRLIEQAAETREDAGEGATVPRQRGKSAKGKVGEGSERARGAVVGGVAEFGREARSEDERAGFGGKMRGE